MENILQNLEMQLAEIELLQSMYSAEEFEFHNALIVEEIKNWIKNPIDELPNAISFRGVSMNISESKKPHFEIFCRWTFEIFQKSQFSRKFDDRLSDISGKNSDL